MDSKVSFDLSQSFLSSLILVHESVRARALGNRLTDALVVRASLHEFNVTSFNRFR